MLQDEEFLCNYWRILRRHKTTILYTAALFSSLAFVQASIWEPLPVYEATSKLRVNTSLNRKNSDFIAYGNGNEIDTRHGIISSAPVLYPSADRLGLFSHAKTANDSSRVFRDLQTIISFSREDPKNIITVKVKDSNFEKARDLANAVVEEYRDYDYKLTRLKAVERRKTVAIQRNKALQELEVATEAVRNYRAKTDVVTLDSRASANLQAINFSEHELQRLQKELAALAVTIGEIENERQTSSIEQLRIFYPRVWELFKAEIQQVNELTLQRGKLLPFSANENPHAKKLQIRIDSLLGKLQGALQQRFQIVQRYKLSEEKYLEQLWKTYRKLPSIGQKLDRLEREVSVRQGAFIVFAQRYEEALISEEDKEFGVTILEKASTSLLSQNRFFQIKRAVFGLVLGCIVGIAFVTIKQKLGLEFISINEIDDKFGEQAETVFFIGWLRSIKEKSASIIGAFVLTLTMCGLIWQSGCFVRPGICSLGNRVDWIVDVNFGNAPKNTGLREDITYPKTDESFVGINISTKAFTDSFAHHETVRNDLEFVESVMPGGPPDPNATVISLGRNHRGLARIFFEDRAFTCKIAAYSFGNHWAVEKLRALRKSGENAYLSPFITQDARYDRLMISGFRYWDDAFNYGKGLRDNGNIEEFQVLRLPYCVVWIETFNGPAEARAGIRDYSQTLDRAAYIVESEIDNYQVRLGAFATEEEARDFLDYVVEVNQQLRLD